MKENGQSKKTYYDLVRDDLMGNHPRIVNLLLVFVVVCLSSVAVFLASDILSSGSHAVQKNGFGGLLQQIPKDPLAALKFWQDTGKIANQAPARANELNGSNKTKEESSLAGNASQPGPAVSSNSSMDEPFALRQASGTITSGIAGSTNGSSTPVAKRNHSSGGQSKKVGANESRTIGSQLNESQLNGSSSNVLQLNGSQENESQQNDSQPSQAHLIEPSKNQSRLNASQPGSSQTHRSESANQSRLNDTQQGISEPMNQTQLVESLPSQPKALTRSEGEIKMDSSAEATGSDDSKGGYQPAPDNASKPSADSKLGSSAQSQRTGPAALSSSNSEAKVGDVSLGPVVQGSNTPEALTPPMEKTAGKIDEGASPQGDSQAKSSSSSDQGSSKATGADSGKGSDTSGVKTLKFGSAQENNNDNKVSSDLSGKGSKTVSASKSPAKIQNANTGEATKQRRPARVIRRPAQPRQVRSVSRR